MRTTTLILAAALLICPVGARADAPAGKTVAAREALGEPLGGLSLSHATLLDVLVTLRQRSDVRLTVNWDALEAVGVTPASTVTLVGRGLALAQALDLTLGRIEGAAGPLCWFVHGRDVHITSRAAKMRLRRRGVSQRDRAASRPASRPAVPTVQLRFDATPLEEVVAFFRRRTGANITVAWRALEAIGVGRETPVTLTIDKPIPAGRALDLVVESLTPGAPPTGQVFWDAADGVITITSGEALDRTLITRVFDVSDLLVVTPDFAGPSLSIRRGEAETDGDDWSDSSIASGDRGATAMGAGTPAVERARREQQLIDAIRSAIGEPYWRPSGRGSIRIVRGKMIISQTRLGYKLLARSLSRQ
ncbi:MAG: hypothetical protein ACOC7R_03520 [Planctomycetota bacterium]